VALPLLFHRPGQEPVVRVSVLPNGVAVAGRF